VICVAACNSSSSELLQSTRVRPPSAAVAEKNEANSDGVPADASRFARNDWAGITCGRDGGCSVSGVASPARPREIDVRMTIIMPIGSTSHYIDK
jgi:hypothetical protein